MVMSIESTLRELESCKAELSRKIGAIDAAIQSLKAVVETDDVQNRVRTERRDTRPLAGRTVPPQIEKAVREYIKQADGQFKMSALRSHLRSAPFNFGEQETGFNIAVIMRQLESEGAVKMIQRGIGRRDGIYEVTNGDK